MSPRTCRNADSLCLAGMLMMMSFPLRCLACLLLLVGNGHAEMIHYQGRLNVQGAPFEGVGRFRFAVLGGEGRILWSSSELKVQVSKGEYSVRLGDSAQAPPIEGELLRHHAPAKLRIWFAREGKAWVKVGADALLDTSLLAWPKPAKAQPDTGVHAGATEPPFVTLSIARAPSLGDANAPLVLVEFTDFRSPACLSFQSEVFPRLKSAYVDTGKLRIVTRVLPAPSADDFLARVAWCAHAQGKFWEMREKLFANTDASSSEAARQMVRSANLDIARFSGCFADAQAANAVLKGEAEAGAVGIRSAPAFILGRSAAGMVAGARFAGEPSFENLAAEIEKNLAPGGTQ